jgi:hypothetical protein
VTPSAEAETSRNRFVVVRPKEVSKGEAQLQAEPPQLEPLELHARA